ncbi:hypothetical protein D9Y22_22715 [Methylorubrum sp. DB1722]|nr:hypothetical protein [Methylorubrum sp. DB1722]
MGTYRLHRGWREPNGLVTDHAMSGQTIRAPTAYDAMAVALADGDFMVTEDTNLVWPTDEQGTMVWSLRLDDEDMVPRA